MPHSRALPTPTYPSTRNCTTFYGAATIAAPAALIWSTLLDFASYKQWNSHTPSIDFCFQRMSVSAPSISHAPTSGPLHEPGVDGPPIIEGTTQLQITTLLPRGSHRRPKQLIVTATVTNYFCRQPRRSHPGKAEARNAKNPRYRTEDGKTEDKAEVNNHDDEDEDEESEGKSADYEIAWLHNSSSSSSSASKSNNLSPPLFHAERVIQLDDFGNGQTELRSYITVGGHLKGVLCRLWGWNGSGSGDRRGPSSGGGGMDEVMRVFAEDVGKEVARRSSVGGVMMDPGTTALTANENEDEDKGEVLNARAKANTNAIVNPERRDDQAWIAP